LPMGAAVCLPITAIVESETLREQPVIVSHNVVDDVVLPAETKLVVVHASAVCFSHSGSGSVVFWPFDPMVMRGQGGNIPRISTPGGGWIILIGGGPGP